MIYNTNNQLNLSQLMDEYLPLKYRDKASKLFKYVYESVSNNYSTASSYKQKVVKAINTLAYFIIKGDDLPINWTFTQPFVNLPDIDDEVIEQILGEYLLTEDSICWDVSAERVYYPETVAEINAANERIEDYNNNQLQHSVQYIPSSTINKPLSNVKVSTEEIYERKLEVQQEQEAELTTASTMTLLEDVLLDPGYPYIPRIDFSNPWLVMDDAEGHPFTIPRSLPLIPQRQCDVTLTTEVNQLTTKELMKLYPDHIMQLRHEEMYKFHEGYSSLDYDDDLGVIFPVPGFTKEQVIDNIIKYPDIINIGPGRRGRRTNIKSMMKVEDSAWVPFESMIEIDGQLVKVTQQLWDELPELSCLPPNRAFQQEYVVRKYLLERDNGIHHEKEMYGTLYPYITLFMPASDYVRRGYKNIEDIVMNCVKSRVSYYRSRSPVLNRLGLKYNYEGELIAE